MQYKNLIKTIFFVCGLLTANISVAATDKNPIIQTNPNSAEPIIKITDINHIGIIVKNIDKSMQAMWQNFGIGPWKVYIYEPNRLKDARYLGMPANIGMKVAFAQLGSTLLELIEPIGNNNIYNDFIRKHGEGIEHFGYYKVKSEAEFFATLKKLAAVGFSCLWTALSPRGNRFAYVDTTKVLHTVLEVLWVNDQAPPLTPDRIFPQN